jgi:hypothetical protein
MHHEDSVGLSRMVRRHTSFRHLGERASIGVIQMHLYGQTVKSRSFLSCSRGSMSRSAIGWGIAITRLKANRISLLLAYHDWAKLKTH